VVSASTKLAKGFSICGSMRFGPSLRLCPACFGWGRSWSQRCHPGAVSIHGIHGSRKHMEKHGKKTAQYNQKNIAIQEQNK